MFFVVMLGLGGLVYAEQGLACGANATVRWQATALGLGENVWGAYDQYLQELVRLHEACAATPGGQAWAERSGYGHGWVLNDVYGIWETVTCCFAPILEPALLQPPVVK